ESLHQIRARVQSQASPSTRNCLIPKSTIKENKKRVLFEYISYSITHSVHLCLESALFPNPSVWTCGVWADVPLTPDDPSFRTLPPAFSTILSSCGSFVFGNFFPGFERLRRSCLSLFKLLRVI